MDKEKVFITRDEIDVNDTVIVWRKPTKGNWSPNKMKDCDVVTFEREDLDSADFYIYSEFKKKFGISISKKIKKCVHVDKKILHNEDYKLFSDDPDRKR
jgi:hypothetical protein